MVSQNAEIRIDVSTGAQPDRLHSSAPLVSVVVPTCRRAVMVGQTVASILCQSERNLELIVVVDGHDPETIQVLDAIEDVRLRTVIHDECRGVSAARNTGLAEARGRWVAFCDDDDLWAPEKLREQLDALQLDGASKWCVVGQIRIRDGESWGRAAPIPTADEVRSGLPYSNRVPAGCSGVLADRELVVGLGGFDERLSTVADFDLWIRLGEASPVAVAREPLVAYRDHPGAMTRRLRRLEDELDVMRIKYSLQSDSKSFPDDMFYIWILRRTFRVGDFRGGIEFARRSPRFRRVMAQRAAERLRRASTVPEAPIVSVDTHPWMRPIANRHAAAPPTAGAPAAGTAHASIR
jgi:glycosyltransferase involved in cell wall biosynthesis